MPVDTKALANALYEQVCLPNITPAEQAWLAQLQGEIFDFVTPPAGINRIVDPTRSVAP